MHEAFACLTAATWAVGYLLYLVALASRATTPSLGFWATIVVVDDVLLVSQVCAGVTGIALMQTVVWVVGANLTLLATVIQQRDALRLNPYERICMLLSVCSIVLAATIPSAAVVIQTAGMAVGSVPMFINAGRGNERWQPICICLLAALLNLGALDNWSVTNWPGLLPPVLAVFLNVVSTTAAVLGQRAVARRHLGAS